jgi:large subunit ribosomal protein L22
MESTAKLRMARVSPRKAALVAALIRGRDVDQALEMLTFTRKKSAPIIKKLVESAVANAEQAAKNKGEDLDVDALFVKTIQVGRGPYLRRYRPRAMGRATPVRKPTSHITVVLGTLEQ